MRSAGPFLSSMGSFFERSEVEIVHRPGEPEETRTATVAHIQPKHGFFELSTPICEGDVVELPDPRGGTQRLLVARVDMHTSGSARVRHTEVTWDRKPMPRATRTDVRSVYNGPVVNIHGANAQVAWNADSISQTHQGTQDVAPQFADLALAVSQALEFLSTRLVDPDEAEIALEAGHSALDELVQNAPDGRRLKRSLTTLRGLLEPFAVKLATGVATAEAAPFIVELLKRLHG